ncbi:MAG TPA: tRNA lysidine(34) synthetase TilS [Polyangiaceae bacterium]|nr:tRNA lysidine(34) synthetase TilS [Polyangiaceae bacterium]
MTRTHPPTLITLATRTLREECGVEKGERLLVAASGGSDSSALLHVASLVGPRLGLTVVAHGVDHGLRDEAARELDGAEALAARCGVPFGRTRVTVAPGGNLQARAREARYEALRTAMSETGATRLATAHHADDRAETVLLRLLHGATPRGLAVLPPADGVTIRPLIRARKADVLRHLHRHDIPFSRDPSNENRRFLRVRVRLEVLPLLEALSPAIVSHLTALADELARGPLPDLMDADGKAVPLNRAQTIALRRAVTLGRGARILLSENRELVVTRNRNVKAYEVRVDKAPEARGIPRRGRGSKKGGAKSGKSG